MTKEELRDILEYCCKKIKEELSIDGGTPNATQYSKGRDAGIFASIDKIHGIAEELWVMAMQKNSEIPLAVPSCNNK